jgi:hypothetical protein
MKVLGTQLDLVNKKAVNLADGTAPTDAVTKQQMDAAIRGLDWKAEAVAASTANVNLASPGASLDGVALSNPSRILLKDQTAPAENGIYDWIAAGTALTRSLDADTGPELSGATVTVQRGTVNADRVYRDNSDDPIVLGTTAITWIQVGGAASPYVAGNGLTLTGQTFDVGAGSGISVAADSIAIDTAVVVRKFAVNIGDGAATVYTKPHGLGTADCMVQVREVSSGEVAYPDIAVDATNIVLTFAVAPASNAYRLIVQA